MKLVVPTVLAESEDGGEHWKTPSSASADIFRPDNYDEVGKTPEQLEAHDAGVAAGGSQRNQQAVETLQLSASPALRKFEALIKARNVDLATAEAIVACSLRTDAWNDKIRRRVAASFAADQAEAAAKAALTDQEYDVSKAYIGGVMAAHERFILGNDRQAACRMIAEAPFLSAFDSYAASVTSTLPSGAERQQAVADDSGSNSPLGQ
jgi:hypothetical protein